jgi:hypothetical protein
LQGYTRFERLDLLHRNDLHWSQDRTGREEVQSFVVVVRLVAEDVGIDLDPFRFHVDNEQNYDRSIDFIVFLEVEISIFDFGGLARYGMELIAAFEWTREGLLFGAAA